MYFDVQLSNRRILVTVNGHSTSFSSMNAGVLQGPVFGPTLFLLNINSKTKMTIQSNTEIFDRSWIWEPTLTGSSLSIGRFFLWPLPLWFEPRPGPRCKSPVRTFPASKLQEELKSREHLVWLKKFLELFWSSGSPLRVTFVSWVGFFTLIIGCFVKVCKPPRLVKVVLVLDAYRASY